MPSLSSHRLGYPVGLCNALLCHLEKPGRQKLTQGVTIQKWKLQDYPRHLLHWATPSARSARCWCSTVGTVGPASGSARWEGCGQDSGDDCSSQKWADCFFSGGIQIPPKHPPSATSCPPNTASAPQVLSEDAGAAVKQPGCSETSPCSPAPGSGRVSELAAQTVPSVQELDPDPILRVLNH